MADEPIVLPKLKLKVIKVVLIGDTSLITHAWSEKAKKMMLDKQQKKATTGTKEVRDPEREFRESLYITPEGRFGFPTLAFKDAAVTACTSIGGMTKVAARQAFRVLGEYATLLGSGPTPREDMVRIGQGTADLRYRAEYRRWYTSIDVSFNENVISDEQVLNIFQTAGFAVGVGEWRPEKNGTRGCFHVATDSEVKALVDAGELELSA